MKRIAYPDAIRELASLERWVCWRFEERDGRVTKVLYTPETGTRASTTNAATWRTFAEAKAQRRNYDGLGFVFTADDDLLGIDLDHCFDGETIRPEARAIVERFDSYTEYSPSGSGLHIWIRARKPGTRCRKGNVEIYDRGRYFTVTGRPYLDRPIQKRQRELDAFYTELFPAQPEHPRVTGGSLDLSDVEVLSRMFNSRHGDVIARLYNGDTSAYNGDDSAADMALVSHLSWWTGGNPAQIDRLFRASALYRDKWDSKRGPSTYGQLTIARALENATSYYDPSYRSNPHGTETPFPSGEPPDEPPDDEPERQPLTPIPLSELFAEADALGQLEWIVPDVIAGGFLHILTARPGTGKTWAGLTLALAVATGDSWGNVHGVRRRNVLWVDEEMGIILLAKRLRQLEAPEETPIYTLSLAQFKLDTAAHVADLVAFILQRDIGLVVIDSLRRVHVQEENSNSEMGRLLGPLKELTATGAAVVILHHTRKGTLFDEDTPEQELAAGAADIVGMMDMAFAMRRNGDTYTIHPTKARLVNLEKAPKVGFRLIDAEDGTIAVYAVDPDEEKEKANRTLDSKVFLYIKGNEGCTVRGIRNALGGKSTEISRAIHRLENAGRIRVDRSGRDHHHYVEANRLEDSDA